jgi:sugar phosphate isomerase/epimerase
MSVVGLPTLPLGIADALCDQIASTVRAHGLTMAASATGNIIHPDLTQRQAVLDGMHTLIDAAPLLGCQVLTISTGRAIPLICGRHTPNTTPQAWATMCQSVRTLLPHAERVGVRLAFEPEQGNVVRTAAQARTLLDTMASPALGVVLDVG